MSPPPSAGGQTRDWRGLGGSRWGGGPGLLLLLLEELEWGGFGGPPRPFRVLSRASRDRVRGRPLRGGLGLRRGGPSNSDSHGGGPGARGAPPCRVRMSVTAAMSSEGSIAGGGTGGGVTGCPSTAPWGGGCE